MQKIVLHTTEKSKREFLEEEVPSDISFVLGFDEFLNASADVFIDLLFINEPSRIESLKAVPGLVIVNSVVNTLEDIQAPFVRINAWPGFSKHLTEACCLDKSLQQATESIFQNMEKQIQWLPDEPGFVTARVISMIINEAYFALSEGISSKEEIDIAMKLGTAYPYGPFEWAERIGLQNIVALLQELSKGKPQYKPAPLLMLEATAVNH